MKNYLKEKNVSKKLLKEKEKEKLKKEMEKFSPHQREEMIKEGKKILEEAYNREIKKKILEKLPKEDMDFFSSAIILSSVISDEDIDAAKKNNNFEEEEIVQLFKKVREKKQDFLLDKLDKIYKENIRKSVSFYEEILKKYMIEKLPEKKKKNYEVVEKFETREKILENEYKKDKEVQKYKESLKNFEKCANSFNIKIFNSRVLEKNEGILLKIAYLVYDPKKMMVEKFINDGNIKHEWYFGSCLTVSEYKSFIENQDNVKIWQKHYLRALNNIEKNLDNELKAISSRKKIILELISNIKAEKNISVMIVSFTIIEGLLWDIAFEINRKEDFFINETEVKSCNSQESFKTTKIREILERTSMKKYLDENFLKYFCEELYNERNPILHGRRICIDCEKIGMCIVKKIFTIDFLLEKLIKINKENNIYLFEKNMWDYLDKDVWDETLSNIADKAMKNNTKEKG